MAGCEQAGTWMHVQLTREGTHSAVLLEASGWGTKEGP